MAWESIRLKVKWSYQNEGKTNSKEMKPKSSQKSSGHTIRKIKVSHTNSEVIFGFEEHLIIMPPSSAKQMTIDLTSAIEQFEKRNGIIKPLKSEKRIGTAQKVIRALYKSRKVSSKLVSVNTKKKKA